MNRGTGTGTEKTVSLDKKFDQCDLLLLMINELRLYKHQVVETLGLNNEQPRHLGNVSMVRFPV